MDCGSGTPQQRKRLCDKKAGAENKSLVANHGRLCFPSLYLFFSPEGEQVLRLPVCRACKGLKSRRELLRARLVHGLTPSVDRKRFLVHNVVIIEFRDTLPKTTLGKVLRRELMVDETG
jgi:hypothetical protein